MSNVLILVKGKNNGLINSIIKTMDQNGSATVFDLTGATVTLEIYDPANRASVLASISCAINSPATDGSINAIPGSSALNSLSSNKSYPFGIKVVNSTYTAGLIFDQDAQGRQLICTVR